MDAFRPYVNVDCGYRATEVQPPATLGASDTPAQQQAAAQGDATMADAGAAAAKLAPLVETTFLTITPVVVSPSTPGAVTGVSSGEAVDADGAQQRAAKRGADGEPDAGSKRARTATEAMDTHREAAGPSASGAQDASDATASRRQRYVRLQQQQPVCCYVCEMPGVPGKFDPKQAAALGVPYGPVRMAVFTQPSLRFVPCD